MPQDHRVVENGTRVPFSCENDRFQTNTRLGNAHAPGSALGAAGQRPISGVPENTRSLWLEHVLDKWEPNRKGLYWLVWYGTDGMPETVMSAVFEDNEASELARQLQDLLSD